MHAHEWGPLIATRALGRHRHHAIQRRPAGGSGSVCVFAVASRDPGLARGASRERHDRVVRGAQRYADAVRFADARQFIEAVVAHDFDAAEALLDADVETVTPRGSLRGIAACRQVLQKASGDEQFAMEQADPEFEEIEGDVIARTHEIARWRETGEVAYQRDFVVRLTLDDERVVRIVVMPEGDAAVAGQSGAVE